MNFRNTRINQEMKPSYFNPNDDKALSNSRSSRGDFLGYKSKNLEFLNRDTQAKQVGFMIGISGEVYTRSLSKNSIVYIEQIESNWEAWRETYQKNNQKAISVKVICNAVTFEYVLLKINSYFDYIERKSLY